MYCIIPLAGPDCYSKKFGIRALFPIDGIPLVKKTLLSRQWFINGDLKPEKIIFVLKDFPQLNILKSFLASEFPNSQNITLSSCSKGALLSAVSGTSLISNFNEPLIIDLVDLIYYSDFSPVQLFNSKLSPSGIIPYFQSQNPKYSYLKLENDVLIQANEKKVISTNASAGTYFFKNTPIFIDVVRRSIENPILSTYKNSYYLCPSYNTLIPEKKVIGVPVEMQIEASLLFYTEND